MLRRSSDDFGVLRVIRLKMRSSRVADKLYFQHLPAIWDAVPKSLDVA